MQKKFQVILVIFLCGLFLLGFSGFGGATSINKDIHLILSTGAIGGTFHPYGASIAQIISLYSEGVKIDTESSAGSVENIRLIGNKVSDVAFAAPDVLYEAWTDQGAFKGEQLNELRSLIGIQSTVLYNTTKKGSDIKSFYDLAKAKIGLPGATSGTAIIAQQIYSLYGLENLNIDYMSPAELYTALGDGKLDFASNMAGFPNPTVEEFTSSHEVEFVSIDENIIEELNKKSPFLIKHILPANTYRGQSEPVITISTRIWLICHADLPDEVAYQIVKILLEHRDDLIQLTALGKQINVEEALDGVSAPIHPGALRYYQEINHPGLKDLSEEFK